MNSVVRRTVNYINHKILHPLDVRFRTDNNRNLKPIFIIGAPRSGSTLLSQVLISAFDLGYFSNLHAYFFGAPDIPQKLLGRVIRYKGERFESRYGDTNGLFSPSECGEYWYRFFRRSPQYVHLEDVDPKKMEQLQQSLARFSKNCGRPVLFKNLLVALRIGPVVKSFPNSLFIIIKRNLFENAQSLLEARIKIHGSSETWLSMEPPDIDSLKRLPPAQQVVAQIQKIHSTIETDLEASDVSKDRIFYVEYENFCFDIHKTLRDFELFCHKNDVTLNRLTNVPSSFVAKRHPTLPADILNKLKDIVDNE